jgi:hypothetical protein
MLVEQPQHFPIGTSTRRHRSVFVYEVVNGMSPLFDPGTIGASLQLAGAGNFELGTTCIQQGICDFLFGAQFSRCRSRFKFWKAKTNNIPNV